VGESGTRITACRPINIHEIGQLYRMTKSDKQSDIVKSDIVTEDCIYAIGGKLYATAVHQLPHLTSANEDP